MIAAAGARLAGAARARCGARRFWLARWPAWSRGEGAVVVLEAGGGLGKTALLEHAARLARDAGCEVRRAAPGPLERHFATASCGLCSRARACAPGRTWRRARPAAAAARRRALAARAELAHSLFWLCSALAAERPLVLVVDDAQWADRPSLEALCYLAGRVRELPVLMAVAARAGDPGAPADLLSLLGGAGVLRPAPLTVWSAVALIRREAPGDAAARLPRGAPGGGREPVAAGRAARQGRTHSGLLRRRAPAPGRARAARAGARRRAGRARRRRAAATASPGWRASDPRSCARMRGALRAAGLLAGATGRFAHGLIASGRARDPAASPTRPPPSRGSLPHGRRRRGRRRRSRAPDGVRARRRSRGQRPSPAGGGRRRAGGGGRLPRARARRGRCPCAIVREILARLALAAFAGELPDARRRLYAALGGQPRRPSC